MIHHIIHHNDLDGYASAAVVALTSPPTQQLVFHEVDYNSPDPAEISLKNDKVTIVDFTFEPIKRMEAYALALGSRFTWYDHHESSVVQQRKSDLLSYVGGKRFSGEAEGAPLAACELAWQGCRPGEQIPVLLKWVGDWDTWRHTAKGNTPAVWAFMTEMNRQNLVPVSNLEWWRRVLFEMDAEATEAFITGEIIPRGMVYVDFIRRQNKTLLRTQGFEATLVVGKKEVRVIAVNSNGGKLTFLDFYNPERHDAMLKFYWSGMDRMTVGLYSEDSVRINCSEISSTLGHRGPIPSGGGHAGAGGFVTTWEHFKTLIKDVRPLEKKRYFLLLWRARGVDGVLEHLSRKLIA